MKKIEWKKVWLAIPFALVVVAMAFCLLGYQKVSAAEQQLQELEAANFSSEKAQPDGEEAESAPVSSESTVLALNYDASKGFVATSQDFLLKKDDAFIRVSLPEADSYVVSAYSMENGYLEIQMPYEKEGETTALYNISVHAVSAADIAADASYEFSNDESSLVLGQNVVGKAGIVIMASDYPDELSESVLETVHAIQNSACLSQGTLQVSFDKLAFQAENGWGASVDIADSTLSVGDGKSDTPICMTPFTRSLEGAGMSEEYQLDENTVLLYGDYKDANTGYQPYIYQTDSYAMKLMAVGQEQLAAAFQSAASTQAE